MPANQERGYLVVEQTEYRVVTVAPIEAHPAPAKSSLPKDDGELAIMILLGAIVFFGVWLAVEVVDFFSWAFHQLMSL